MTHKNDAMPVVIFLDFDGTIVGDVTPQVTEWDLVQQFCPKHMRAFKDALKNDLSSMMIIRNQFTKMIHGIKEVHPNVEFFVFTASDTTWANVIIPAVEAASGVTLNRPILSRKHCTESFQKSLRCVAPIVLRKLKPKYPALKTTEQLYNNAFIVDNTDVLVSQERKRWIHCPTYNGVHWSDVLRFIPLDVVQKHYVEISLTLESAGLFPRTSQRERLSFEEFRARYYVSLAEKMRHQSNDRRRHRADKFWMVFGKVMMNTQFENGISSSFISSLNKKIREHTAGATPVP